MARVYGGLGFWFRARAFRDTILGLGFNGFSIAVS